MDNDKIIEKISIFFKNDSSGHDLQHTLRVLKNALLIAENETCRKDIVTLAALLHDVDDVKLFDSHNYKNARQIMSECSIDLDTAEEVIRAISTVSFKGSNTPPETTEGKIVQDADRLDALGAIGIARAFAYGASKGRCMHDPSVRPSENMSEDEYRSNNGTTVNHFYEKLFLLKDLMNTETARNIAAERDRFMHIFIDEFLNEWDMKA